MLWAIVLLLVAGSEAAPAPPPTLNQMLVQTLTNMIQQTLGMPLTTPNIPKDFPRLRPTTDMIKKEGYPTEGHYVTTEDGYTLRMDRIPRPGAPAVLLGNVLSCSSVCFAALGNKSLSARLYDAGYDVWLGNWRGSGLSLKHSHLKPSQREFWNFGLHEHGTIDLPAMVDYVLGVTREPSLTFVGHSMGSTAFLVTASERPEYDRFINGAFLMGPVGDLSHHNNSALLKTVHRIENSTAKILPQRFPGSDATMRVLGGVFCRFTVPSLPKNKPNKNCRLLNAVAEMMGGAGSVEYPVDLEYYAPSGISFQEVNHYAQLSNPDWTGFRKYNYGKRKNREIYGQDVPPNYDLTKNRIPVYTYTGKTDVWTPPQAINDLRSSFKNFRKAFQMPDKAFGHFDFLLNPTRAPVLYNIIIQDMKELRDEQNFIGNNKRSATL